MKCKRVVLTGKKQSALEEIEFPKVNGNPIVQVTHVGICGSDVHFWEEGDALKGVVLGHEYTGIVLEPGNTPFRKGDRVLGYTQNPKSEPCGFCMECLQGNFAGCSNANVKIALGCEPEHPGAYSEYVTWFPAGFFLLPESVSNREAALIEPSAVGLHAVNLSEIKPGDNVLILGGGIIGQCVSDWARMYGANTIVLTEINPKKIEMTKSFGTVDHVLDASSPDLESQLHALVPDGFDLFFDCVALSAPVNMAIRLLRRGGTGVLLGVSFAPLEIDYYTAVMFQKRLQGSKGHVPRDFEGVLAAVKHGKLDLKKYISKTIKLEEVQETMEWIKAHGSAIKVLIEF